MGLQFSTIITIRLIMFISATLITSILAYTTTRPCAQIDFTLGKERTLQAYPACSAFYSGTNALQRVLVEPGFKDGNPMQIAAALGITFGTAGWLALWIHAVLIEVYVGPPAPRWLGWRECVLMWE